MQQAHTQDGFSLIELMVSTAIAGIVLAAISTAYLDQLRTNQTTRLVIELNQNIRAALVAMERDVRMLGTDPTKETNAGVILATDTSFCMASDNGGVDNDPGNGSNALNDGNDNDGDGIVDEGIDGLDNDGDGLVDERDEEEWFDKDITDKGEIIMYDLDSGNLRRRYNLSGTDENVVKNPSIDLSKVQVDHLARNIDVLNFVYLDDNNPPQPLATPVTGMALEDIRAVQVTIVARAFDGKPPPLSRPYTDKRVYTNQQGEVLLDKSAAPDHFRRKIVTTTLKIRTRQ